MGESSFTGYPVLSTTAVFCSPQLSAWPIQSLKCIVNCKRLYFISSDCARKKNCFAIESILTAICFISNGPSFSCIACVIWHPQGQTLHYPGISSPDHSDEEELEADFSFIGSHAFARMEGDVDKQRRLILQGQLSEAALQKQHQRK